MRRAKLIKREQINEQSGPQEMRQNNHNQLGTQGPSLIGIAAIKAEVEARMTTSERQKREQARGNFNNLFTQRP